MYNISDSTKEKNKEVWSKNLTPFQESVKKRRDIPAEEEELSIGTRLPLQQHIIGRYHFLAKIVKSREKRAKLITLEFIELWRKMSIPHIRKYKVKQKNSKPSEML